MLRTRGTAFIIYGCAVALLTVAVSFARQDHDHDQQRVATESEDPATKLPPKLRDLLNEEMRLIDGGMGDLASSISRGDWGAVAKTAEKIQQSFILKQKLAAEDVETLHAQLPDAFIEMDIAFHRTAGKLVHVAHARDAELAGFYFHRMLDACVSCHATYAPSRFPGLAAPSAEPHGH